VARRARRAPVGATEAPDVVDEELRPWEPQALEAGFEIEDVRLGESVDLTDLVASGGRVARSRLEGVRLAGSQLRSLRLVDVVVSDADVSNADWTGARVTRVVFERCRMTGFGGASLQAEHVTLRGCKLDLANFRRATLRSVTFEDCVLDDADLARLGPARAARAAAGARPRDRCERHAPRHAPHLPRDSLTRCERRPTPQAP
jgi:fluoroquinolone resistance protein